MTAAEKTRMLAERVVGWKIYKEVPEAWLAYDDQGNLVRTFATFAPLTNLAHAGEVLEAMVAGGWTYIARNVSGMHMVGLAKGEPSVRCFAPTLAAAICHAALLANGVKEEEL